MKDTASRGFGAAAEDYALHRAGFPHELFQRIFDLGVGRPGWKVADIGTGTGCLGRGFARRGCEVVGVDPDSRLLEQAAKLDQAEGLATKYMEGTAEDLPLADGWADLVCAGQCWHWFRPEAAAMEFARVCRAGGAALVAHFDWLPLPGSLPEATESLILKHSPAWTLHSGNGFHPESALPLHAAGFRRLESLSFDVDAVYSPESWRGRIRASAGVAASLSPEKVHQFDQELAEVLAQRFPGDVLLVPHRAFALWGWRSD